MAEPKRQLLGKHNSKAVELMFIIIYVVVLGLMALAVVLPFRTVEFEVDLCRRMIIWLGIIYLQ